MLHANCAQPFCPFVFCLLLKPSCARKFLSSLILPSFVSGVYVSVLCLPFFSRSITMWPSMALRFLGLCLRYSSASSSFASIISLSFPDITLTAVGWFSFTLYFLRFAWLQCRFFNPLRLSIEVPSDVPGSFTCNCISRVLLCLTSLLKAREKYLSGTYPVHILSLGTLPVYKFIYSSLFAHPRHTFELPKPSTAPSAAQKDIMRRLVLAQRWWDIDTLFLHPQQHKSFSMLLLVGLLSKPRSSSFGSGWG